jgi:hypothetical protein
MHTFKVPSSFEFDMKAIAKNDARIAKKSIDDSFRRLLVIKNDGTLPTLHEYRNPENPFYRLNEIQLITSFPDPLGGDPYNLFMVSDSVPVSNLLHETVFIDVSKLNKNTDNE